MIADVRPRMDQRRLINAYRPPGPATAFITTEKATLTMVCGMAAIAQMASTAGTACWSDTIQDNIPVNA
jgi:hypothetical protein